MRKLLLSRQAAMHSAIPTGAFVRLVPVLVATLLGQVATAEPEHGPDAFSPPGLYEPAVYRLENGLQVVLAPREGARSVAIRAVVGLGTENFPCPKQETPHFLEHLMFTGTSQYSEEELELLVASHGGSWNAFTGDWNTVYEIDIFSGHAGFGIETLHAILTDTEISHEEVEISREILLIEGGGAPSLTAKLLNQSGVLHSASTQAFNRLMSPHKSICIPPALANAVSRAEIEDAYRRYYVPENMSLVIVGDFDSDDMRSLVARTFGTMPAAEFVPPLKRPIPSHPGAIALTGFGGQASVGVVFRAGGYLSDDNAGLRVVEAYLSQRIYQVLRVERGLTYTPSVAYQPSPDVGLFWITAEVDSDDVHETKMLIDAEIERIRRRDVDLDALEKAREGLLLSYARGFESNTDIADYYVASLFELEAHGAFVDEEKMLKSLTVEAILRSAANTFAPGRGLALRDRRLLFEEILASSAIAGAFAAVYIPWRVVKRAKTRGE